MTDIATEDLARIIKEHPFFAGLDERLCNFICDCAAHVQFDASTYLFHEGGLQTGFIFFGMAAWRWRSRPPGGNLW